MGTDELMELIFKWSQERWPRRLAVSVVVKLADGDKVTFPMPDVPYKPPAPPPPLKRPGGGSSGD